MDWFATSVVTSLSLSASTVAELVLAAESSRCMGVTAVLPPIIESMTSKCGKSAGKSDSSSNSQLALLRLVRSAMDMYLFLRAFIICRHCTSVGWKPCLTSSLYVIVPYCPLQLTLDSILTPYLQKQPRLALSPPSCFFRHFFTLTIQLWREWVAKLGRNPACKQGR